MKKLFLYMLFLVTTPHCSCFVEFHITIEAYGASELLRGDCIIKAETLGTLYDSKQKEKDAATMVALQKQIAKSDRNIEQKSRRLDDLTPLKKAPLKKYTRKS